MPYCILNIIWINGLVQLKLLLSLFEASGVIQGNPPLPMVSRSFRGQLNNFIEVRDRFLEVAQLKMLATSELINLGSTQSALQRLIEICDCFGRLALIRIKPATHIVI